MGKKPPAPKRPAQATPATLARYEAFAEAWVHNGRNGTQAAIAAGYSPKTAHAQASRLLTIVKVQEAIERQQARISRRYEVTKRTVIAEMANIGFFDPADVYETDPELQVPRLKPIEDWPPEARRALIGFKTRHIDPVTNAKGEVLREGFTLVEARFSDKQGALVKLGQDLGMFVQRHRHSGVVKLDNLTPEERLQRIQLVMKKARERRQLMEGAADETAPAPEPAGEDAGGGTSGSGGPP